MKIKLSKIDDTAFIIRETIDQGALEELKESLKNDGQWNPIILRPHGEIYELIAGHRRFLAASALGWEEIEANIRDLSDLEAMFLALKTNLVREEMTDRDQGAVLHEIIQKYNITEKELAERIGKSTHWVTRRIKLALNLAPEVAHALEADVITMSVAEVIAGMALEDQTSFLAYITREKIERIEAEVRKAKHWYLNNKIYTIGYEGKELNEFINILKKNGIEVLLDIRFSVESSFKPDFSKTILSRELERKNIKYVHKKDLGVPHEWQNPYKDGGIDNNCFEKYYRWHLAKELDFSVALTEIKEGGRTALMCYEKYATVGHGQKINCHRSILATRLRETGEFKEVINL